ncbi:hypothetical protein [Chondrinema litorale]|uniref:hypothetical protein n=1 Tax=Chondrinema litorale TaxID=2994555 RepID=UPI002542F9D0|nr:hypothetical protein [Chondrinema litorale]UZR93465.1 hypothetical protein OQ292_16550 [Chondrinema litorale]
MVRYNRFILVFRILKIVFFTNIIISNLPLFFSIDAESFQKHFIAIIFSFYFTFTVYRIFRQIFAETFDIEIDEDAITLKHIITRKKHVIEKASISGYRIESYNWSFIKISGIKPFWEFEFNMVVIYSNYKALHHFKSSNYLGLKKIVDLLEESNYSAITRTRRFFDRYRYLKI